MSRLIGSRDRSFDANQVSSVRSEYLRERRKEDGRDEASDQSCAGNSRVVEISLITDGWCP